MRAGDRLELVAADLDLEGLGVGVAGGVELHADGLLPGERGEVTVAHVSRHAARAWGAARRTSPPAPERVPPGCPAFSRCGGCAWQHLDYAAQLEHKRRRVERALAGLPGLPPVAPVAAAARQLGYRNKAIYVAAPGGRGPALGAYAPRSHEWVDTAGCRVVMPAIEMARAAAAEALATVDLAVYDERSRTGQLRYVILRASRADRVLVGLVTTSDANRAELDRAAQALIGHPAIAGVIWVANDATSGAVLAPDARLLAGAGSIEESIAGVAIEVGIDTFLQIHLDQADALYTRLADRAEAGPATRAIDLYCGVGAIAFTLAARGARTLGLERNPQAVRAATRAASRASLDGRARFEAAPAADLAHRLTAEPIDLLVVNPPRQGLDDAVRAALAAHPPPRLAYVSCGPDSLGRDLAELTRVGLHIDSIEPFDFMPGTGHIETLVLARGPG